MAANRHRSISDLVHWTLPVPLVSETSRIGKFLSDEYGVCLTIEDEASGTLSGITDDAARNKRDAEIGADAKNCKAGGNAP
jgi:hypothetical protein